MVTSIALGPHLAVTKNRWSVLMDGWVLSNRNNEFCKVFWISKCAGPYVMMNGMVGRAFRVP